MKTYEELLEVGMDDIKKGEFCVEACKQFMASEDHKEAEIAEMYYNKRNYTIERFQKWLYTVSGRKIEDVYSANYKIKTLFFRRQVIQLVQYLLSNGVKLSNDSKKDRLGSDFDSQVQKALKMAMVGGRAFGFWNVDHLEVFGYACTDKHAGFCPLYSEDTADMMAGIRFRFKKVGKHTIGRYTLYEPEGITEFIKQDKDGIKVLQDRKPYKTITIRTVADGVVDSWGEGYNGKLPIIPLYANDCYESELVGLQESIDCYDLIKSGLANNIDDASEIFWLVKNCGGMDDPDLAQFLYRLKTTKAASVDVSNGGGVEQHEMNVPTEARRTMLELLRSDLYEDMMIVDMKSLSAAQKTTQEIQSAYQSQDNKVDDIEYCVIDWLKQIFELAGIGEEEPTFTRSKVVNEVEQTSMVISAANYVSPECIIRHLPWLSADEQEEEIKRYQTEQYDRFSQEKEEKEEEEQEEEEQEGEE